METDRADAVVIGGGATGTSTLYHLARAGCTDAVLLERGTLASGSTSAAAGGFRAQFSDELNIRIALASIDRLARFADEIGTDIDFRQPGYLFLLTERELAEFAPAVALQRSLGVPTEVLDPAQVRELVPGVSLRGLAGATFCPIDGLATPESVAQGYAAAARRLGASVRQSVAVTDILVEHGAVTGVRTDAGTVIHAPVVVLAAGVWSRELAAGVGIDLPVTPERRYVYHVDRRGPLPAQTPLTIDFATGFYFHSDGPGLLLGGPWSSAETLAPVALHRLPLLADLGIAHGWSGFYEMSPDHNAIVGGCATPRGLYYATGFSGHGFQQAPVVGEYLADLALGRAPALDLSPLRLDRFAAHAPRPELNVV
jgi:sarcosine oxidase subunit beta